MHAKCKRAEEQMLRHFDGTITPKNACELARHVLLCKTCRELYLLMDEAAENSDALTPAPENLTALVMAAVRAKPKSMVPRLLLAINLLVFGAALTFALNPDLLLPYPAAERAVNTAASLGDFFNGAAAYAADPALTIYGTAALFFVAVTGTLLFVLHRGENVKA